MTENAAPTPDAQLPAGTQLKVRRMSGLVIFAILLTIGSFALPEYLFYLGPFAGVVLGLMGWRAAKKDPMIIGPVFALAATGFALVALGFQIYIAYRNYPRFVFQQAVWTKSDGILKSMEAKKIDEVFAALDEDAKAQTTLEEMEAVFAKTYPEDVEFVLADQWTVAEFEDEDLQTRLIEFLENVGGEIRFVLPVLPFPEDKERIVHLRLKAVRPERTTIEVAFLGFTLERKQAPPETDSPATGTGAADTEKPETGTGSEPQEDR